MYSSELSKMPTLTKEKPVIIDHIKAAVIAGYTPSLTHQLHCFPSDVQIGKSVPGIVTMLLL